MLDASSLTESQQGAVDRLYEHDFTLLHAKMGSGKTVCALTAAAELLRDGVVRHVLVVAPLTVAQTVWPNEILNWSHLTHLDMAVCLGPVAKREAALARRASITVINFENLPWLFRVAKADFFDGLIVDELSRFKAIGGAQFKAMRAARRRFVWTVGMTGTPVSEDWTGLYGQMLIVDGGRTLGTNRETFLRRFFYPTDYNEYNWALRAGADTELARAISGVVYSMDDYRDSLPPISHAPVWVEMPAAVAAAYADLKSDMVTEVAGAPLTAATAAVLTGKLSQCAGGFLYDEDGVAHWLSDYRICAAVAAIEESDGPVMVCYWYRAEYEALCAMLTERGVVWAALSEGDRQLGVDRWNAGELQALLVHPRSAGHGLNLAQGGAEVLWLAPQWSRDLEQQTNARVWRRGQTRPVRVRTLMARESIDTLIAARVEEKGAFERLFCEHLGG